MINKQLSLFIVLAFIDFESGVKEFDELPFIPEFTEVRQQIHNHWMFKVWWFLYKISPNFYLLDTLLTRFLGGHIAIGRFTWFGYNAMMWAIQFPGNFQGRRGYWLFRPPCFLILGKRGFNWGRLYFSPNGTPRHEYATHFWNKSSFL